LCKETALAVLPVWALFDAHLALSGTRAQAPRSSGGAPQIAAGPPPMSGAGLAYLLYAAAFAVTLVLRHHALGGIAGWQAQVDQLKNPLPFFGPWQHLLAWAKTYGLFAWLFLRPIDLSIDYAYNAYGFPLTPHDPLVLLGAFVLCGGAAVAWACRRRTPLLAGGVAWSLVTFFPVSNGLVALPTVFGERFLYLPAAGLAAAGAAALVAVARRLGPLLPALVLSAFVLWQCALGFAHALQWRNNQSLFAAALAGEAAGSAKVQFAAATERFDAADLPRAEALAQQAATTLPMWPAPHDLLAVIHASRGETTQAEAEFTRAEALMVAAGIDATVRVDHALFLMQTGRPGEAADLLRRTLAETQGTPDPRVRDLLARLSPDRPGP
jgi:tetratricopeptide (TPR) repeat protein